MPAGGDFTEVGHSGGRATFRLKSDAEGRTSYSVGYRGVSAGPMRLVAVYAHRDGFVCGSINVGGLGEPWNPPPLPNCFPVFLASDSEGRFGHECPQCEKHFRSEGNPRNCPYCGLQAEGWNFLTPPQKSYVQHYLATLFQGIATIKAGEEREIEINMDEIADLVTDEPRPDFYYGSVAQQTQFKCHKCGGENDVRGRFAYCCVCGSRNNAVALRTKLDDLRARLNDSAVHPADAVKQAISEFDSCARNFVDQLVAQIPMKPGRQEQLQRQLFHNLATASELLRAAFDIEFLKGIDAGEREFLRMMFARRHVYEHDGGAATAKYVADSGDLSVDEGVLIRETPANVHRLIGDLNRMVEGLETDFHEIFPPDPGAVKAWEDYQAGLKRRSPT